MVPHADPAPGRDSDFLMEGMPPFFVGEQAAGTLRE